MTDEIKVKKKPKNYINNADLMIEIEKSRNAGKMTNELAKMLTMLCERYSKHSDYSRIYSYNEDMKSFAMLTIAKVWKSFDPEKSKNPFAYFTQIIRHAFYQYLNYEKKQREIKDEVLIDMGFEPSFNYMEKYNEDGDDVIISDIPENEPDKKDRTIDIRDSMVDPDNLYHHDQIDADTTSEETTEEDYK
jgi:DNA-directed RNA polymerase specialized sigma24 family protein